MQKKIVAAATGGILSSLTKQNGNPGLNVLLSGKSLTNDLQISAKKPLVISKSMECRMRPARAILQSVIAWWPRVSLL
jgi:hypothetical protein